MDYGKLLSRAWDILWEHKFLILLGLLVALTSGGNAGLFNGTQWRMDRGDFSFRPGQPPEFPGVAVAAVAVVVGIALLVGLGLWVVSTIARGGLIAGVSEIDGGGRPSFGDAWRAGWQKGWRLIGIGLVPAIPGLLILLTGLALVAWWAGVGRLGIGAAPRATLWVIFLAVICILGPIALILNLLRVLANRACVMEDTGVFASYGRGIEVLLDNIGPAIILFLIQAAISVGIGFLMVFPGFVLFLCCFLWPILWLIQGAISAYFSSLWTLAWRQWTGASPVEPVLPAPGEGANL
jgi:hypothetical protein